MLFNIIINKKMVSFSFLETLFFLILGTTFVLILLLIYHFKKRITDIEFRSDKLFAMVKCLAEEIQSKPNNSGGINNDIYPLNMSPENITAFKNLYLNVKLPNEIDLYDIIEDDEIDDDGDEVLVSALGTYGPAWRAAQIRTAARLHLLQG